MRIKLNAPLFFPQSKQQTTEQATEITILNPMFNVSVTQGPCLRVQTPATVHAYWHSPTVTLGVY